MERILEQREIRGMGAEEPGRVDAVLEGLKCRRRAEESLADVAHELRNMVAALSVYCDLLEEPGVLTSRFAHYGSELRLVAAASRRLAERLTALDAGGMAEAGMEKAGESEFEPRPAAQRALERHGSTPRWDATLNAPIANLAEELLANHNVLAALAGPSAAVSIEADGGARPVRMSGEDLTRVLINLVKNASEAMPGGGRIRISLRERAATAARSLRLVIAVEDDGRGIPEAMLEKIFERGYSTRALRNAPESGWPAGHRGLGLAISRVLAENAGGKLVAVKCARGARLEMELPVQGLHPPVERQGRTGFVVS